MLVAEGNGVIAHTRDTVAQCFLKNSRFFVRFSKKYDWKHFFTQLTRNIYTYDNYDLLIRLYTYTHIRRRIIDSNFSKRWQVVQSFCEHLKPEVCDMVIDLSFYHNVLKHLIDKTFMESQMKMEEVLNGGKAVEDTTGPSISENELLLLLFHNSMLSKVSNTITSSFESHSFDAFVCYLNDIFVKSKDAMEFIQAKCNDKKIK
ncbi:hypothetical protein RFI_36979, partial [Reticulomyxa filosa]